LENEEIKKNLIYINNFLGYGESDKARVFHIAIEEKLDFKHDKDKFISNFISQREKGEKEILKKTKVHSGTEKIQSRLSYRIINEILGIDMGFTEEEYLKPDFEILRDLEFCSNVFPLSNIGESEWADVNTNITGYDSKNEFLKDSWNGTGKFEGVKSRQEVMKEFLTKIKYRMEKEKVFLFIEGNDPYKYLKENLKSVFEIDTESNDGKVVHRSHLGREIHSFYNDSIWSVGHPSYGHFNDTDIDNVITYLKNSQ